MSKNSPYIAQRILEKNKKNNSSENKEIIDYFKVTESYFENKNKNKNKDNNIKEKIGKEKKLCYLKRLMKIVN